MNAMVRIGLDSGQGSVKVTMNIFDPEELDGEKLTGCNKLIILAFVKDVSECHSNIDIIHKKANLDDIKHYKACDLKLLNILLGISGHGGLHSCLYCDGLMSTPGTLRTFGSLKKDYQNFMEAGGDESKVKNFNNAIKTSIIEEQDDVFVIDTIPIPELHIYLKITTTICTCLKENIDGMADWFNLKGIFFHGYNGGGLDGPNCKKVLSKLSELREFVKNTAPKYECALELLESFQKLVDDCFGMQLNDEFENSFERFMQRKVEMEEKLKSLKVKISFGWKGHILFYHLVDFIKRKQKPLGLFSEQASESSHKAMKKSLNRFMMSTTNTKFPAAQEKAVATFSSMRV